MRTNPRGMTLIELMTAVAVLGVLVALSVAGYQTLIAQKKSTAAIRELWSSALRARQAAISHNEAVRFVVEDVTRDGRLLKIARWERLPCEDNWGNSCPSAACQSDTCRSGCPCSETGPEIVLPDDLTIGAGLDGLCFLPGSGRAFVGTGGLDCQPPDPMVNVEIALTEAASPDPYILELNNVTGLAFLADCNAAHPRADLCP
ncbi:MAG: prepilin-type N-terminal cleavage/methylation domain-containing protein [Myxococcaceae bacterium]